MSYQVHCATVYALHDRRGNVFYVGCTAKALVLRLAGHISEAKSNLPWTNVNKNSKIIESFYEVFIVELEKLNQTGQSSNLHRAGAELEKKWIYHFHSIGAKLTNCDRDIKQAISLFGEGNNDQILESEKATA